MKLLPELEDWEIEAVYLDLKSLPPVRWEAKAVPDGIALADRGSVV